MKNFVLINFASVSGRLRVTWAQAWSLLTTTMFLFHYASAQEMNHAAVPLHVRAGRKEGASVHIDVLDFRACLSSLS
jgi:hypothetical protein